MYETKTETDMIRRNDDCSSWRTDGSHPATFRQQLIVLRYTISIQYNIILPDRDMTISCNFVNMYSRYSIVIACIVIRGRWTTSNYVVQRSAVAWTCSIVITTVVYQHRTRQRRRRGGLAGSAAEQNLISTPVRWCTSSARRSSVIDRRNIIRK